MNRLLKINREEIMLKDPESNYETKSSEKLLKVKKFDFYEEIVIGH